MSSRRSGALLAGGLAAFVVAVDLARAIRPALLLDPDPGWAAARLLLGLAVLSAAVSAGAVVAAAVFLWGRSPAGVASPQPLPFRRRTLVALALSGLVLGAAARLVWLDRVPGPLFQDEVVLVAPSLELTGGPRDFADSIRPIPYGVKKPHGMIGVLYLEFFRLALLFFGTSVAGVRSVSALAGLISMGTAFLLGRELLPRGGGTLTLLVLAGLRWHMLLSRWGWHAIALAPLVDLATLLVLRSRRRGSLLEALGAGLLIGVGAHVYLAAWVAAAALVALSLWPSESNRTPGLRPRIAALFLAGVCVTSAPLFVFHRGREIPYFVRTGAHNILREMGYRHSVLPLAEAAADGLASAWFVGDPEPRHDIPGRSRLGWILGVPAAVALARALRFPRAEFSGFLFSHSGAGLLAAIASGEGGHPNSVRFGYLTTVAAVVSAGGLILLVSSAGSRRRAAAISAVGLLAIGGALSARDVLLAWNDRGDTFLSFHGQDTLIARAAIRWERYGAVTLAPGLGAEPTTIAAVRRFRLDPQDLRLEGLSPAPGLATGKRSFRVSPPGAAPGPGERLVERVRDPWGREWAVVLGVRGRIPPARSSLGTGRADMSDLT